MSNAHNYIDLIQHLVSASQPLADANERIDELLDEDDTTCNLVFGQVFSSPLLSASRRAEIERHLIGTFTDHYPSLLWSLCDGYLRHRWVAERMIDCYPAFQDGVDEELRYLLGEYIPNDGDPSADDIIISIIQDKCAGQNVSHDGLKMIEGWIMSKPEMMTTLHFTEFPNSLSPSKRAELLRFILEECVTIIDDSIIGDILLDWIRQGLLADIPYNGIDQLKLWVKSRDDRIEYLEAGLWPYYSDNEKALMIAPLLDRIESAKTNISDLVRLLRLEESSPLLREARAILAQMNLHFQYI